MRSPHIHLRPASCPGFQNTPPSFFCSASNCRISKKENLSTLSRPSPPSISSLPTSPSPSPSHTQSLSLSPPLSHTHMATPSRFSSRLKIGIIGFGPFAQFLAKTMIKQGHILRATSRSDHSRISSHLGISFFRDMSEFLGMDNDVILLCTSILSLSEVLKSVPFHCLKRPTLFADVLSVKEYPRQLLLQVLPEECDVVCTHPMFGPDSGKDGWKDLTFVYDRVRVRDEVLCLHFLRIFETEGCKMLEMTCEEHDQFAARSQFLTHTVGRVLSEMEIKHTPIDTKGFEKLVQLKENTVRDSFDLFTGLFIHNRFAKQQLENLETALQKVKEVLITKVKKEDRDCADAGDGDGPRV